MNDVLPAIYGFLALAFYGVLGFFLKSFYTQWNQMKKDVIEIKMKLGIIQSKATRIERKVKNGDDD